MNTLTPEQQKIIDSLTNEFKTLNTKPAKKGGLIDISLIHQEVETLASFNKSCDAEILAHARLVHSQIVSDIAKIEPDLNALGIKIKEFDKTKCQHCILLMNDHGDTYIIHYNCETMVDKVCQRTTRNIPTGLKLRCELKLTSHSFTNTVVFKNIESVCNNESFRNELKRLARL
jgi:hypothetical protein